MSSYKPLVSVITIVYNGVVEIENTIKSVLHQDYDNFELIIIDGGSNDGTVDIIEKYKDKLAYYISEKDQGIYDAMNKGIRAATGTWLNFMNAGDSFHNKQVLSNVFNNNPDLSNFSLVYGYKYTNGIMEKPQKIEVLEKGIIMANHQSMFFNKQLLGKELLYSLKYPIYGDYELVNRIYLKRGRKSFKYLDLPIAIYEGGGISSKVSAQKRKDKYLILWKSYGLIHVIKGFVASVFTNFRKKILNKVS